MSRFLFSASAIAILVTGSIGGALAQTSAPGQITCQQLVDLDHPEDVLHYIVGYMEGQRASDTELDAATGAGMTEDDTALLRLEEPLSSSDATATADIEEESANDVAATEIADQSATDQALVEAPDKNEPLEEDLAQAPEAGEPAAEDLTVNEMAADAIDTETTAAVETGTDEIVGMDFDVQQVLVTCQDNPTMTVWAAIDQYRGLGYAVQE
jgi:hypothetical protein